MTSTSVDWKLPLDERECVELLQRLVATRTVNPPGDELASAEILRSVFAAEGIEARVDELSAQRANVVARLRGSGDEPALMYNGHLDTVPPGARGWERDPWSAELADGRVWGLGALDMKGGVAAATLAAIALRRSGTRLRGDLVIAATAGEEVDSIGAQTLAESGELVDIGAIVVAEPTALAVTIAEKGALWVEVDVAGQTAHGATPHLGVNAIERAHRVVAALLDYRFDAPAHELLAPPTISINMINAGVKTNVVPDLCRITLDMRTVPGQSHERIVAELGARAAEAAGPDLPTRVTVTNDRAPMTTPGDAPIVQAACAVVEETVGEPASVVGQHAFTDASKFAVLGVDQLILGPGRPEEAHCPNEGIAVAQYLTGIVVFERLARRHLGVAQ